MFVIESRTDRFSICVAAGVQNYFRDYDPAIGRYVESDLIGLAGGVNTYAYAGLDPILKKDPRGLDYWIEGPNPNEPAGHQSVCVGDPLGRYRCFSFGATGECCLIKGEVYEDTQPGGQIKPSAYRKTNVAEDYTVLNFLEKQLGTTGQYTPWNTCRNFSMENFITLIRERLGTPEPPPKRAVPRGSPSVNPPRVSSTITDSQ